MIEGISHEAGRNMTKREKASLIWDQGTTVAGGGFQHLSHSVPDHNGGANPRKPGEDVISDVYAG